jgi:class 3 adenylate cyclase
LPLSLLETDGSAARFLSGGQGELTALFGSPLPQLPAPDVQDGREVFFVRFHPKLRAQLLQFLKGTLAHHGVPFPELSPKAEVRARELSEYEDALRRALFSTRINDRRQGLPNLFWLATSREVAQALREIEARVPQARRVRYSLQPILSSFFLRAEQSVRRELQRSENGFVLADHGQNTGLIDSIVEDGMAFVETGMADLDIAGFASASKRHRISGEIYQEFESVIVRDLERRLREGERALLARVARHASAVSKEVLATRAGALRVAFNEKILAYLLGDAWGMGARLLASPRLKAEADRRGGGDLIDAFLDFVACLKRFEVIANVRERICVAGGADLEDKVRRGVRLYDFGESAQVLNNAVNATVLFLDLRGFTKTSEVGTVSERDLTSELYTVFDAFVPHVLRFGGTIDKFLGDGMMIHYGTGPADPLGPLNAVRTAILCQKSLHELRQQGRTNFKMGVSIHYGRVYLARFIADAGTTQNTIIGRNVNLAGRLSSAAKKPMEEDEANTDPGIPAPARALDLHVTVDAEGTLFNEGIAISRASFVQLESQVEMTDTIEGNLRRLEYYDAEIKHRILFRYAGDAKFKGVRASFPVFEVDYE